LGAAELAYGSDSPRLTAPNFSHSLRQ